MADSNVVRIELNLGGLPKFFGKLAVPISNFWQNHRLLFLLIILIVEILFVGGWEGAFAYQTQRYVKEGDKHFSWERYQDAVDAFRKADSAWKKTFFVEKFRQSPTEWRVEKALVEVNRLIRSHENYLIGIGKYEDKKWKDAVSFLSKVEEDAPDYLDAQSKIKGANKQIAVAKKKAEEAKRGEVAGASTQIVYRTITPPTAPPPQDKKTEQKVSDLEKKVKELESKPPDTSNFTLSLTNSEIDAVVQLICIIDWVDETNYNLVSGSGTIWSSSGIIYTNRHVVANSDNSVSYTVCLAGNTSAVYYAALYGYSASTDVAILFIYDAAEGYSLPVSFPYLTAGSSSSLKLGDDIWLAGYPATVDSFTLTKGIVSGKSGNDIVTDASISYGNSGGAAFDKDKKFVGIPTGGYSAGLGTLGYIIGIDKILSLTDWITFY